MDKSKYLPFYPCFCLFWQQNTTGSEIQIKRIKLREIDKNLTANLFADLRTTE